MNTDRHRLEVVEWRSGEVAKSRLASPYRHITTAPLLILLICVHLCSTVALFAQQPPTADLPGLDELLDLPKQPGETKRPGEIDKPIEDGFTTEPFELAVEGMRDAALRLASREDPGIETQRVQEQVVKRLDMLISQMRRQQQRQQPQARQQDSGSQQQQDQQQQQEGQQQAAANANDPNAVNRQQVEAEQAAGQPIEEQFEEWGKLPPRVRDALRNVVNERFSTLYEELTQRYYQRLAEESNE